METELAVNLNSPDKLLETDLLRAQHAYAEDKKNLQLFDRYLQMLIKANQIELAISLIKDSPLFKEQGVASRTVHAHLLYKMKKYDESDVEFEALIAEFPEDIKARILYAQILRKRKKVINAYLVIKSIDKSLLDKKQIKVYDEIMDLIHLMETLEDRELQEDEDYNLLSMKQVILSFHNLNDTSQFEKLGKLSLITGSLGPGGAERQVCLTAIHFNELVKANQTFNNIILDTQADVLINAYDTEKEKAFFLPLLHQHQINLYQIKDLPNTPISQLSIMSQSLEVLLNECPSSIRYGINHLVDYFRNAKTKIAFIWQDGAILFSAIAALIAGVSKIVLNFRGYPPSLRPHLFKPEYFLLYKNLALIPKVKFVTNTLATAKAYADWLDIPAQKFQVIYNGISPPEISPTENDEKLWAEFQQRTENFTETIGGVFRFETDKRPILMIRLIRRFLRNHPNARFVLVGEGRLRKQCMQLAQDLEIAERILFVGLSRSVGYWMLKMDVVVLMSLYEGLPNVLIEAQYMGVPVVSTPAGGAEECFINSETGFILENGQDPDLTEACEKIASIINSFKNDPSLKEKAIQFANQHFSISKMIDNTLKIFTQDANEIVMEPKSCEAVF